jgi:hypothetical protein
MKIKDIFPSEEQIHQFQSIESTLLKRRAKGKIAGWGALFSALIQIIILLQGDFLDKIKNLTSLQELISNKGFLPTIFMVTGILFYLLYRRTSILLKETNEPFRYTFFVEKIVAVEKAPIVTGEKVPDDQFVLKNEDRLGLLHHDLTELINQRIKRFSILSEAKTENDNKSQVSDARRSSHIHIYGYYAIREDKKNDEWVIHVMPYVRIGPPGSPATLAQSVRFPLSTDETPDKLDTHEYNQLLERVYSRITTEIYAQIVKDIQNKIILFPTSFLKANALYNEARDMANSNTINAFESAIILYEEAIREINLTLSRRITGYFLKIPFLRIIFVRNLFQYARIQIGHAKCLVYKNRIAALSGKKRNPVFEIRQNLKDVIDKLEDFYLNIGINSENSNYKGNRKTYSILAYLSYPNDSWLRKMLLKPSKTLFDEARTILFNAYVVHSLTDTLLNAFISARNFVSKAKAIAPDLSTSDPLYILAQAYIEPNIDKALFLFQEATEKDPSFQIAQYDLAFWTEMKFRINDEINENRARIALDEYDKVLRINPGNIAALSAQGYIYWLLHKFDIARRKFEEGCELKTIVSETFIGQLIYGRARILVEQGKINESYDLFNQAFAANPNVGTFSIGHDLWMSYSFYDFITPELRKRFVEYYSKFHYCTNNHVLLLGTIAPEFCESLDNGELTVKLKESIKGISNSLNIEKALISTGEESKKWIIKDDKSNSLHLLFSDTEIQVYIKPDVSEKVSDTVFSYVLNDYGNANFNYYKRAGDRNYLNTAIENYNESIKRFPKNTIAKYNQSFALIEKSNYNESIKLINEVIKTNPKWFEALACLVEIYLPRIYEDIKSNEDTIRKLENEKKEILERNQSASQRQRPNPIQQQKNTDKKLREIEEQISNSQGELVNQREKKVEILRKIRNILEPTKLISLYDGMQLELLDVDEKRIDSFIQKKLHWSRLDENDVRALWIYVIGYYHDILSAMDSLSHLETGNKLICRLETCNSLFDHLLTFYYPEDFEICRRKKEIIFRISQISPDKKKVFYRKIFSIKKNSKLINEINNNRLPFAIQQLFIDNGFYETKNSEKIPEYGDNSRWKVVKNLF